MGYQLHWEPVGLVRRYFGQVTDEEFTAAVIRTGADARFDDLRYMILDMREGDVGAVTTECLEHASALERGAAYSNPAIRLAIVVAEDAALQLALAYASSPENIYPTRIFPDLAEARAWACGA